MLNIKYFEGIPVSNSMPVQ